MSSLKNIIFPKRKVEDQPRMNSVIVQSSSISIPKNKIKSPVARRLAADYDTICSWEISQDKIIETYEKTPAYSLNNRNKDQSLFFKNNSISKRINRWYNEKLIITPQDNYEKFNTLLNIILMIFTIILIIYIRKNNIVFAPKDIINYQNMDNTHKKQLDEYSKLKTISDIIQGIGLTYLLGLGFWRVFKRTTQSFKIIDKRDSIGRTSDIN